MGVVNLKGTSSGIILELDPKLPFDVLITEIANKFRESRSFLGKASMGIIVRGRTIIDEEENEILGAINENSDINVTCVLREDPETDKIFASYIKEEVPEVIEPAVTQEVQQETSFDEEKLIEDKNSAVIHAGNLRSGQTITYDKSVIIMGDVKPGASVNSKGSIFVLGALRGSAYAGTDGNENAFVMALEFNPLQVRIANSIAISPDSETGPKIKVRRFRKTATVKNTEVAYILNGHIVKDIYGAAFLRDNRFI